MIMRVTVASSFFDVGGLLLAFVAQIFDDPLVRWNFLGRGSLHQLLLGVDRCDAWQPGRPAKSLGLGNHFGINSVDAGTLQLLAVLAVGCARTWNAKLLAFTTPASDFDLFVFADQMAYLRALSFGLAVVTNRRFLWESDFGIHDQSGQRKRR